MKHFYLTVLLFIICSLNLFSQSVLTSEEYAVQDAVLEEAYTFYLNKYKTKISFVVLENTVTLDFVPGSRFGPAGSKSSVSSYSLSKLPSHLQHIGKDFREMNKVSAIIKRQASSIYDYDIISENELNSIFEDGKIQTAEYYKSCEPCSVGYEAAWHILRKKYPNATGYYRFSRVGFGTDRKTAVIFFAQESAGYESSSFYVLKKNESKWQVVDKMFLTISGS